MDAYNPLTPEEKRVLIHKGTERPFTGEYTDHFASGVYLCRQCNTPLYFSHDKFHSGCGWPSFEDEIPKAVKKVLDADGRRTEIVCNTCDGHLGHVFEGERLTDKNVRHCVNSISMKFVPQSETNLERAIFASGCFWGKEYLFQQAHGVITTRVGYIGGQIARPTYREVRSGLTGHTEAVEVIFDRTQTSFETLAKLFFNHHNPTNATLQGENNTGKYRSAIFYVRESQKRITRGLIRELYAKGIKVVTQITPASKFYAAEAHHQNYYNKLNKVPDYKMENGYWVVSSE